jgi:hypothetical protein
LHLQLYENIEFGTKNRPIQLKSSDATFKKRTYINGEAEATHAETAVVQASVITKVQFEEFESYSRCPLQHHYRYRLGLSREQETDISVRARWAVMDTLRAVAKDHIPPKSAFAGAWTHYQLPDESADPHLTRDAKIVCRRGLAVISKHPGTFNESLVSRLNGLDVELPWMVDSDEGGPARLHLIRFSASGSGTTSSLLRPMLLEIEGRRPRPLVLHTLLVEKHIDVKLSQAPEKTSAFKAAPRMLSGDHTPVPGRHCSRCAYLSVCPVVPS